MTLFERITAMTKEAEGKQTQEKKIIDIIHERCTEIITERYVEAVEAVSKAEAEALKVGRKYANEMKIHVDDLKKKIKESKKLTTDDCAILAICIIAAWTYRVRHLDLKWWETNSRHIEMQSEIPLQDLPAASGLG